MAPKFGRVLSLEPRLSYTISTRSLMPMNVPVLLL
jgi:hypothetical protein